MSNVKKKGTLAKVLKYIKKYWIFLGISIVMAAVTVALTLFLPILTGKAIDLIVAPGKVDFDGIMKIIFAAIVVIGITAIAQWIMNVCNNKMAFNIIQDVRGEAMRKIEILPLKYIDGHSYGEVVSKVVADVDQFSDGLLMGFTQFFNGIMTIIGTLIFMFIYTFPISKRVYREQLVDVGVESVNITGGTVRRDGKLDLGKDLFAFVRNAGEITICEDGAVGCLSCEAQSDVGVHGEDVEGLGLGGAARQQQQGKEKGEKFFHSSRRPSSARIKVASSANSRCPPTGMP